MEIGQKPNNFEELHCKFYENKYMKFIHKAIIMLIAGSSIASSELHAQHQQNEPTVAIKPDQVIAVQLYDSKGKKITYAKMLNTIKKELKPNQITVVLYGEYHDNPIAHWLQYQTTSDLYQTSQNMILGAEMFETNQQQALNAYLLDPDTQSNQGGMFGGGNDAYEKLKKSTQLWPNFKTDYKPLVDFAKDNNLPFIATNIPRKYARLMYKGGYKALDTLPLTEKTLFATTPFPYDSTLSCYAEISKAVGGHGMPATSNLAMSQAIKDATMASETIKTFSQLSANTSKGAPIFIHYNGCYHSDNHQSIEWYLNTYYKQNPMATQWPLKIITISTRTQTDVTTFDKNNSNIADFIIVTPESMTRTH